MSDHFFILFCRPSGWSIATPQTTVELSIPANSPPSAIAGALKAAGYGSNPIAIGIPSAWCLSASISTTGLPRSDPRAMLYRLEESLPLAAESVIADFVVHPADDSALGVCVRLDAIAPLVEALEVAGVAVQSIVPTAMATAQGLSCGISQSPSLLLCSEPGECLLNVIVLQDGQPTHWALLPATVADLKLQLDLLSTELGSIPHIEAIDLEPELAEALVDTTSQIINFKEQTGPGVATAFIGDVLRGREKPWIEFRRNQLAIADPLRLHRRWIDRSLAAAIMLLLSLTVVFLIRAHRYNRLEKISTDEMVAAFSEHFPGWDTPVNVRAVVDAQYRQAAGTAGSAVPRIARRSALITLHDVLIPMLAQDHFQIERMAFHDNSFEISGRLQSYEQVDALSNLARQGGMTVAPAQTRRDADGTWTFTLQGTRPGK